MILTLELPPDVEARLRESAASHDGQAVRHLLTEALAPILDATVDDLLRGASGTMVRRADGLTDAEFEALVDELVTLTPTLPSLPDEAISRSGIYDEHP